MKFELIGKVTPKQRPRFGSGHAYLPQGYRDWKDNAIADLIAQYRPVEPIQRAAVLVKFLGAHRGDLDNLVGSVLDALVQAGVLLDDRMAVVPMLTVFHEESKVSSCSIEITPIEIPPKKSRAKTTKKAIARS